jgi:hypothetical protein
METTSEALAAFDLLEAFHEARWGRRGAFANPGFRPFLEELIACGLPMGPSSFHGRWRGTRRSGLCTISCMTAAFLTTKAAFPYERGRLKPGLISHLIEDNIVRGERGYDFRQARTKGRCGFA